MIISCPSCSTHYNFPDQRLTGDGMAISCAACGHSWIESRAIEIVDISP
ncbi:MAG: zinc-ribbon domain-containing protein, partial [Hyphomicrobiales bacterium]|nr:zinc-ribbon domain-containing protein [Hyphomicrobiales bacterium]